MTSTCPLGFAGIALLGTACGGPFVNPTRNSCDERATRVFCSVPPDDDEAREYDTEVYTPVAVCEVDAPEQSLPDALFTFDGTASYSQDGLDIVGYEWSIVDHPDGSFPALNTRTGSITVLEADAVGSFDVQLNVIDDLGLRSDEPCIIRVEVVE